MSQLNKTYEPADVEQRWYAFWEDRGFFHADEAAAGRRFCMVIPPPNITGSLTIGHVLNNSLQDALIRYHRMAGDVTLWMPGTDHAGIATQNVVERQLASEGSSRHDLGREKFIERVWAWKEKYGSTILLQLRRLGCSCDWRRERFTMDPGLSLAVREVFVRLYEKGLIYKGRRIIHWCPRCVTALSDEEAVVSEGGETGSLWYIRYPAEDGGPGVVVATTRPETMLGDTGVAVHPDDARYKDLLGKRVILPLMNRAIPVVGDALVDPAFGTGAVKVTPAHDANDFEMGQRHGLEPLCIMDTQGVITAAGRAYAGMDRMVARKAIVADLEAQELLVKTEPYRVPIRRCQRCNTVIEPYLSDQWFVRMAPLAVPAVAAVRSGALRLLPERWEGVYLHWMENIRDWCISRQLWWGHRIPVWYCDDCSGLTVSRADPTACSHCRSGRIRQDPDVLDTWFSSWLWPFSTMGWPDETPTLARFYPTDVLSTGGDIIFFWVARMVMAGYEFMGEKPFHTVLFHSIVRDMQGRKMSKSLGNSPDPLKVMDDYGADALRFTIIALSPPGEDIRFGPERAEFGRNFANKVWNAARFALQNIDPQPRDADASGSQPPVVARDLKRHAWQELLEQLRSAPHLRRLEAGKLALPDRWILSRLQSVIGEIREAIDHFRFNDAAMGLYRFIWHEFCDWYVELSKLALYGDDAEAKLAAQAVLVHGLEQLMRLLHPFMPFITEEIWQALPIEKMTASVMVAPYPAADDRYRDAAAEEAVGRLIETVRAVRNIRSDLGIPPVAQVTVRIAADGASPGLALLEPYLRALAKVGSIEALTAGEHPAGEPSATVAGVGEVYVPLRGLIDVNEVRGRIERDLKKVSKELDGVDSKLARPDFVEKAPAEIVEKERAKASELGQRRAALRRHLEVLAAAS